MLQVPPGAGGKPAEPETGDGWQHYMEGSPINHVKGLKGDLLLAYGTGDDNCHYQNCEALVNELVRHGKQFRMMSYPNRSHGIHEGRGTRKHLFTQFKDNAVPAPLEVLTHE